MVASSEAWQAWYDRYGCKFGQFIHLHEAEALRDAAPRSLRDAELNRDAVAVGRYMRRWQESFCAGGEIADTKPCVPGDTFCDPATEFSKIVGFLSA